MSSSKKITLISCEGERFEVEEAVALESHMLKRMIEDNNADGGVPTLNLSTVTLAKVIEYCKKHVESPEDEDLKAWDAEFVRVDISTLCDLISAANYLDVKDLFELTCNSMTDLTTDKSPEEIRRIFRIGDDYTPGERRRYSQ